jgi:hypothetical protein
MNLRASWPIALIGVVGGVVLLVVSLALESVGALMVVGAVVGVAMGMAIAWQRKRREEAGASPGRRKR